MLCYQKFGLFSTIKNKLRSLLVVHIRADKNKTRPSMSAAGLTKAQVTAWKAEMSKDWETARGWAIEMWKTREVQSVSRTCFNMF